MVLVACAPAPFRVVAAIEPVDPTVPLNRHLDLAADAPFRATVSWTDPGGSERALSDDRLSTSHAFDLLGLAPATAYALAVDATDADERGSSTAIAFETGPLPASFPELRLAVADADRMEPGLTLVTLASAAASYAALLDADGTVRWLLDLGADPFARVWWEAGGRFLAVTGAGVIDEDDLDGRVLREWAPAAWSRAGAVPVDVDAFHHDLAIDADGTFLALDRRVETFASFRTAYDDADLHAADAPVMVDRIVRFDPGDGAVLAEWDLGTLLDPERLGYDSLDTLTDGSADWTHANAVAPLDDGGAMVSLRHQDAVVALSSTGQIAWIAGNPVGWSAGLDAVRLKPASDFPWFYHQHAPVLSGGQLMLFDNGNWRSSPGDGLVPVESTFSRVVALAVDPLAGSIDQRWEWQPSDAPLFSGELGNATPLEETGNTLVAFGRVEAEDGVALPARTARLVELSPGRDVVWQVELGSGEGEDWSAFRAYRVPAPW